jgi:hypothetical protein
VPVSYAMLYGMFFAMSFALIRGYHDPAFIAGLTLTMTNPGTYRCRTRKVTL